MQIDSTSKTIGLLGVPFDDYSSFHKGPAEAPPLVRDILFSGSLNGFAESGIKVKDKLQDCGDVSFDDESEPFEKIQNRINSLFDKNLIPLIVGGDHSISFPILQALKTQYSDITIVHFDAHPDLYHEFKGNPLSHACPFARIMENKLATRLIQFGIRANTEHQIEQARKFGVESYGVSNLPNIEALNVTGPIYISFDLDGLDPAFAPGVSHIEPGGLATRQVLDIIQALPNTVIGADIVEYNPKYDINNMTAYVCGKLVKEIAVKML